MLKKLQKLDLACGQTYLATLSDGEVLELGDVYMSQEPELGTRPYRFQDFKTPSDLNKRVMTICAMVGCPMSCTFCASRNSYVRKLGAQEIVAQVDFLVEQGVENGREADLNNSKEFRVLITRMGEPLLNMEAVWKAMGIIKEKYPKVIFGISTIGINNQLGTVYAYPEIMSSVEFQISIHSTCDLEREKLFNRSIGTEIGSLEQIANFSTEYYRLFKKKVSLNMILFKGFEYDFLKLAKIFDRDHIWIRLSPWNPVKGVNHEGLLQTKDVMNKKPLSSDELRMIIDNLNESRITYSYAPAIDEEIKYNVACGQAFEAFNIKVKEYVS